MLDDCCHVALPYTYIRAGLPLRGADRIGMVVSGFLAGAAACVALLSFATRSRKWYWSGSIEVAMVIWQQIFLTLAISIPFRIPLKSASALSCAAMAARIVHLVIVQLGTAKNIGVAASRLHWWLTAASLKFGADHFPFQIPCKKGF